jgi:hypothetical protein
MYPGARIHRRLHGRLVWMCSYGPQVLTCLSRATASRGRSTHSIMRTGARELGPKLLDTADILGTCLDATDAASRG